MILLLILSPFAVAASNFPVSLRQDNYGLGGLVEVTIPGLDSRDPITALTLGRSTLIATGRENAPTDQIFRIGPDIEYRDSDSRFVRYTLGSSQLGIGPGSSLARLHGPLAYIQGSTARLVLNSTESYFREQCVPGSIAHLRLSPTQGPVEIEGSIFVEGGIFVHSSAIPIKLGYLYDGSIMSVSGLLLAELRDELISIGLIPDLNSNILYQGCENRENAPIIRIEIIDTNGRFASIAVYPEDYLRVGRITGRCTLMIASHVGMGTVLNLLQIPGLNARTTFVENGSHALEVCDTNFY